MKLILIASAATGVILSSTSSALAQVTTGLDVASGVGRSADGPWLRQSQLAPAVRFDQPFGYVAGQGTVAERLGQLSMSRTSLESGLTSPSFDGFGVSGRIVFDADASTPLPPSAEALLDAALSYHAGKGGLFAGGSQSDLSIGRVERQRTSSLSWGAWRSSGPMTLSVEMLHRELHRSTAPRMVFYPESTYDDTTGWRHFTQSFRVGGDSSASIDRWTDVQGTMQWALGRLSLTAVVVTPTHTDSLHHPAGEVNAVIQVGTRVALIGGTGIRPTVGDASRSTRFATIGVRLSRSASLATVLPPAVRPAAYDFSADAEHDDLRRIVVRAIGARVVEVSGDFTHWHPTTLRQTAENVWEVSLPIAAGTHYLNLRVNGDAWLPPPGLPAVDDDFNGRVGVLVIR